MVGRHFPHAATKPHGAAFSLTETKGRDARNRRAIRMGLRTLRMWREMGDREGEERCSQHIDQMLDRLRRYERQDQ